MSKKNIEVTPESIQEAYKTLGISFEKSEDPDLKKSEDNDADDVDGDSDPEDDDEKAPKKKGKKMEKSEDNTFDKAFEKLSKSLDSKFEALVTINKGLSDQLSKTNDELVKAQDRIEELETSSNRKSITSTGFIEKAFQENEETGKKMLSVSQHKNSIQNLLIEKAGFGSDVIEKGQVNDFWRNEMEFFESTGSLHPKAIEKLFAEDNIQLVK